MQRHQQQPQRTAVVPTPAASTSSALSPSPPAGDEDIDPRIAEYVRRHNLAALMDVLVQQLIEQSPEDPFSFLADRLRLEKSLRVKGRSVAPMVGK